MTPYSSSASSLREVGRPALPGKSGQRVTDEHPFRGDSGTRWNSASLNGEEIGNQQFPPPGPPK
jgi:hypothetical protein